MSVTCHCGSREHEPYQHVDKPVPDAAVLLDLLRAVEWVQPMSNSGPSCSYCGNMKHWGHEANCRLMRAIR